MIAAAIVTPLSLWKMYAFYLYYNTYMGKWLKKLIKKLLRVTDQAGLRIHCANREKTL